MCVWVSGARVGSARVHAGKCVSCPASLVAHSAGPQLRHARHWQRRQPRPQHPVATSLGSARAAHALGLALSAATMRRTKSTGGSVVLSRSTSARVSVLVAAPPCRGKHSKRAATQGWCRWRATNRDTRQQTEVMARAPAWSVTCAHLLRAGIYLLGPLPQLAWRQRLLFAVRCCARPADRCHPGALCPGAGHCPPESDTPG